MDYYFIPEDVADFPKGGALQFDMSRTTPIASAQRIARDEAGEWLWGQHLTERLWKYFNEHKEVEVEAFHDFIPNEKTFVELDPDIRDKWGLPAARMHLYDPDLHLVVGRWLLDRGREIAEAMDADEYVYRGIGIDIMTHGTCRAGSDPTKSVLNEYCQAHEVPNLFVVDGSFMPTSGGVPTTLTIMANSFRTADYIVRCAATDGLLTRRPLSVPQHTGHPSTASTGPAPQIEPGFKACTEAPVARTTKASELDVQPRSGRSNGSTQV